MDLELLARYKIGEGAGGNSGKKTLTLHHSPVEHQPYLLQDAKHDYQQ